MLVLNYGIPCLHVALQSRLTLVKKGLEDLDFDILPSY